MSRTCCMSSTLLLLVKTGFLASIRLASVSRLSTPAIRLDDGAGFHLPCVCEPLTKFLLNFADFSGFESSTPAALLHPGAGTCPYDKVFTGYVL